MEYVVSVCTSFGIATVMLPIIIRVANQHGWFDRVGGRKIHTGQIPRLGGIAVYLAVVVAGALALVLSTADDPSARYRILDWALFFAGISAMFTVGLVDDFANIPAMRKLAGQVVAALAISLSGFRLETVSIPFSGVHLALGIFSYPITVIWIVAIANAVNLIDGMDGFAGGVVLISSATFATVGAVEGSPAMVLLSLAMFGASAGFLLFNRPPASIFMGDSGSLLFGTLLAVVPLMTPAVAQGTDGLNLFVLVTILGIPILDTLSAITRRVSRHQPIHQADNEHLHHKLLFMTGSTRSALYVLYAYQVIIGVIAVVSMYLIEPVGDALLLLLWIVSLGLMFRMRTRFQRLVAANTVATSATRSRAYLAFKRSSKAV